MLTLVAVPCVACTDGVVLRDGTDGIMLAYECDTIRPVAMSTGERALVRRYGAELLRTQGEASDTAATATLMASYDSGDWARFERLVVERLCADRTTVRRTVTSEARTPAPSPWRGRAAPAFDLPVLARPNASAPDSIALADLRGRHVIVTFWGTYCAPCLVEYPELVSLEREFGDRGLSVVGILYRDTPASALDYVEALGDRTYTTLVDRDGSVAAAYRVFGAPVTVLVAPDGTIVDYSYGWYRQRADEVRTRLDGLLPRTE